MKLSSTSDKVLFGTLSILVLLIISAALVCIIVDATGNMPRMFVVNYNPAPEFPDVHWKNQDIKILYERISNDLGAANNVNPAEGGSAEWFDVGNYFLSSRSGSHSKPCIHSVYLADNLANSPNVLTVSVKHDNFPIVPALRPLRLDSSTILLGALPLENHVTYVERNQLLSIRTKNLNNALGYCYLFKKYVSGEISAEQVVRDWDATMRKSVIPKEFQKMIYYVCPPVFSNSNNDNNNKKNKSFAKAAQPPKVKPLPKNTKPLPKKVQPAPKKCCGAAAVNMPAPYQPKPKMYQMVFPM